MRESTETLRSVVDDIGLVIAISRLLIRFRYQATAGKHGSNSLVLAPSATSSRDKPRRRAQKKGRGVTLLRDTMQQAVLKHSYGDSLARLGDTHTCTFLSSFITAPCAHVQSLGAPRRPVRLSHLEKDTQ